MVDDRRTRRQFLAGAGVGITTGLAGCAAPTDRNETGTRARSENTAESTATPSDHGETGTRAQSENTAESTGHAHTDSHGSSLDGPSASVAVTMKTTGDGTHFEPHAVWVEQGGTVTWKLDSGSHTTTTYAEGNDRPQRIPDDASGWNSGTLSEPGTTFEHTFETVGVYDYFCIPHQTTGMIGTVIVGDPAPEGQPALEPPQDNLPSEAKEKIRSLNRTVVDALRGSGESGHDGSTSHGESTTANESTSGHH